MKTTKTARAIPRAPRGGGTMKPLLAALAAALLLAAGASAASTAAAVSSNWSGYAVTGTNFRSVSGTWTQPAASCSSATAGTTASAFWVGLGGDSDTSSSLEQTGTEADCLANGTVRYAAWYELVPKASVRIAMKISPGDRISASVQVSGTSVTLKLADLTTGATFAKTLTMSSPDVSSAEWIAEAPSAVTPGGTTVLPLTDFGTVRFTKATATSTSGHTGTISDSAWTASKIRLVSGGSPGGGPGFDRFAAYSRSSSEAVPSSLTSSGGAFSVTYRTTTQTAPAYASA